MVCDAAVAERHTQKKSLIGIFDRISVAQFPVERAVSLYFKITDAEGDYDIRIRVIHAPTDILVAEATGGIFAQDRLASTDLFLDFPPLPIAVPGRYEFQVWANDMFIGQTSIDAVQRPSPSDQPGG